MQEVVRIKMGAFGWGELFSLLAVIISCITVCVSLLTKSKNETRSEQQILDKLDQLSDTSRETNDTVKAMNAKIDDHSERLARLESDNVSVFRRLKRIEETQDKCQACRAARSAIQ